MVTPVKASLLQMEFFKKKKVAELNLSAAFSVQSAE